VAYPICLPNDKFVAPRSYYAGLYVRHDPGPCVLTDNLLQFIIAGPPDATVSVRFADEFLPWSSNKRTLDFITTDAWYQYPTTGEIRPLPFYLYFVVPPGKAYPYIGIDAMYGSTHTIIPLEAAPAGYWLTPP
jgi:hypothetical protein